MSEHLIRDQHTDAVLNKDNAGLTAYKQRREAILRARDVEQRMDTLEASFQNVTQELQELKHLVLLLVQRN